MPNAWPKNRRLIGTKISRLDGPEKATGRAKYSYDINRPGMLHARILRSPYAHARLKKLDTTAAEKMPGVAAIHVIAKVDSEFLFAGDEILGLAADTEQHAIDALKAIKIDFDVLPHVVKEEDVLAGAHSTVGKTPNLGKAGEETKGNVDPAFKEADAIVEGDYGIAVIAHQCLESHGLVAEWTGEDKLTVWMSTQATSGVAGGLAKTFGIPAPNVKCITHYMGGGFGSKFTPGVEGITAAHLAKKASKPVKLMLDREEEITTGGTRPGAFGTVKIAGKKDGTITAFQSTTYGSPGATGNAGVRFNELPYVYSPAIANLKKENLTARTNTATQRAWRAPGHPQSSALTEWPIDDLAAKLGLDPMLVRLKNLPPNGPGAKPGATALQSIWNTLWTEEINIAARLSDWAKKWHPPGKGPEKGPIKHGIGMALHTWGGAGRAPNDVRVRIGSDGSVLTQCSTQDLGTGERTVLAIVIAETLGLEPQDITVRIGESEYGQSTGSGGSTTCPGTAPAALNAAVAARDAMFDKLADRLKAKREDLAIEPGKIVDKGNNKTWTWKEACARLGMDVIEGKGDWTAGLSNNGVGGVQIAEVKVDTETGVVRVTRVVAVQDCGLIINKLGCESQVAGGVIMGVNPALFEERIMDRQTGRQVNADMEFYKLGGIEDMPEIIVHMHDMPERGVIGIGEPPTISTCAAIGNAIFNAIGVRVPRAPFTPDRVLDAILKGGKA